MQAHRFRKYNLDERPEIAAASHTEVGLPDLRIV